MLWFWIYLGVMIVSIIIEVSTTEQVERKSL